MASKFPSWVLNLIVSVLGPLVGLITPQLKEAIAAFVRDLANKAKETESPLDDIFVKVLAALLDVDLEG